MRIGPVRIGGACWADTMQRDESTLARLMRSSLAGDRPAYVALLTECRRWLERYYARRLPPSQIDDLVQETLISLHRKRTTYDQDRPFLPWLAAIARYRWVDHLRREKPHDDLDTVEVGVPSEESAVIARLSLDAMLATLPPRQAEAITLIKIDGLSVEEAAAKSGQSTSLIRVNVHRGLRKLATAIEST